MLLQNEVCVRCVLSAEAKKASAVGADSFGQNGPLGGLQWQHTAQPLQKS